ncbi:MAG: hypothetical protein ACE5KT_04170 [Methanosarcinales archaeon]
MQINKKISMKNVKNGKILKTYDSILDMSDWELIDCEVRSNIGKWCMKNMGAGALHERKVRLVELENGKKVWWAEIADNEWHEKVADWIFDENGNTLLCYPKPSEFNEILIEIDIKHGFDDLHRPLGIKKEKHEIHVA